MCCIKTTFNLLLNFENILQIQYKFIHETIGYVIRKQNENEPLSEDAKLLNHNDLQHPTREFSRVVTFHFVPKEEEEKLYMSMST